MSPCPFPTMITITPRVLDGLMMMIVIIDNFIYFYCHICINNSVVHYMFFCTQLNSSKGWFCFQFAGMESQHRYEPVKILRDNQGAITLSKDPVNWQRGRYIDIKYHFIRDAFEQKENRNITHLKIKLHTDNLLTNYIYIYVSFSKLSLNDPGFSSSHTSVVISRPLKAMSTYI